jgi:hypothetical protein
MNTFPMPPATLPEYTITREERPRGRDTTLNAGPYKIKPKVIM